MDYLAIVRQSYNYIKKHRFLWILGILAAEGAVGYGQIGGYQSQMDEANFKQELTSIDWTMVSYWLSNYWTVLAAVLILLIIVLIFSLYISFSCKAGLIVAIDKLEREESVSFSTSFTRGEPYVFKLIGLSLLINFLPMMILITLILSAVLLVALSGVWELIFVFFIPLVVLIIMMVPLAIYLNIIYRFAMRLVVLENKRIIESIKQAHQIIRKRLADALILYGINILSGFVLGLGFLLIGVIVVLIASPIVLLGWFTSKPLMIIVAGIFLMISVVFLVIASGIVTAFNSSLWTLGFRAINYMINKRA